MGGGGGGWQQGAELAGGAAISAASGGTLTPLVLGALSAAASTYNQHKLDQAQNDNALAGIAKQRADQKRADNAVQQTVQQVGTSSPEAATQQAQDAFVDQLRRNKAAQGGVNPSAATTTGADPRFAVAQQGAQQGAQSYGQTVASNLAGIIGSQNQHLAEGTAVQNLRPQLTNIDKQASDDQFLTQLKARSLQANPWVALGAKALQAGAMASAAGVGSGGGGVVDNLGTNADGIGAGTITASAPSISPSVFGGYASKAARIRSYF